MTRTHHSPPVADDVPSLAENHRAPIDPGPAASRQQLTVVPGQAEHPRTVWRARPKAAKPQTAPLQADPRGPYAWVLPRRLLFLLDVLATAFACLVAWQVLLDWRWLDSSLADEPMTSNGALLASISLFMFAGLVWNGGFATGRRISGIDDGLLLVKHLALAVVLAGALAFATSGFGTGFTSYSPRVLLA